MELARHDVLLAEGLPAESYLDTGNRGAFANGGPPVHLHPAFARAAWQSQSCAPLVLEGPYLAAAKRHLLAHATTLGNHLTEDPGLAVLAQGGALAAETDGRRWRIHLPDATRYICHARTWTPAHDAAGE